MVYSKYTMEITTVKVRHETKMALDALKHGRDSYDDVIARFISQAKKDRLGDELIEGYSKRRDQDLSTVAEWDASSPDVG